MGSEKEIPEKTPRRKSQTMIAAQNLSKNDFMIKKEKTGNVVRNDSKNFLSPDVQDRAGSPGAYKETPQFNISGKVADEGLAVKKDSGFGNILEGLDDGPLKDRKRWNKDLGPDPKYLNYDCGSDDGD